MTAREKLAMEHPEFIDEKHCGGCKGCPDQYGYLPCPDEATCANCWDREIPETFEKKLAAIPEEEPKAIDKDNSQPFVDILGFKFPCGKEWQRLAIDKFKAGEVTFNQLRERFGMVPLKDDTRFITSLNTSRSSSLLTGDSEGDSMPKFFLNKSCTFGVNSTHMSREQFEQLLDELDGQSLETLKTKNARYSSDDDTLHNFNAGAEIMGVTPAQCAWGYATKHLVALRDKILKDDFSDRDDLLEKCQDIINYIRFIWCLANQGKD